MKEYLSTIEKNEDNSVRQLFDVFDYNKDGFISPSELQAALTDFLQESVSKKDGKLHKPTFGRLLVLFMRIINMITFKCFSKQNDSTC